ncbi:hypothetical protein QYF36_024809 [Acer negundo]|nr:hypothetical protein QYF36_024809 [Acer negundo]
MITTSLHGQFSTKELGLLALHELDEFGGSFVLKLAFGCYTHSFAINLINAEDVVIPLDAHVVISKNAILFSSLPSAVTHSFAINLINAEDVAIPLDAHVVISKNASNLLIVVSQLGESSVDDCFTIVKIHPKGDSTPL